MLDTLYTDQFDAEQIWQQIDHKYQVSLSSAGYIPSLSHLLTNKESGFGIVSKGTDRNGLPSGEESSGTDSEFSVENESMDDEEDLSGSIAESEENQNEEGTLNDSAEVEDVQENKNTGVNILCILAY